jgi:hypothetical protein
MQLLLTVNSFSKNYSNLSTNYALGRSFCHRTLVLITADEKARAKGAKARGVDRNPRQSGFSRTYESQAAKPHFHPAKPT